MIPQRRLARQIRSVAFGTGPGQLTLDSVEALAIAAIPPPNWAYPARPDCPRRRTGFRLRRNSWVRFE